MKRYRWEFGRYHQYGHYQDVWHHCIFIYDANRGSSDLDSGQHIARMHERDSDLAQKIVDAMNLVDAAEERGEEYSKKKRAA